MANRVERKVTTDEKIAQAFKELALTNPIEKITIQEIADKAGVIRPTFYNHFEDKYDLLKWIIKKELIIPVMPIYEGGYFYEGLVVLFTNAQKNKAFYLPVSRIEGVESFEKIIVEMIKEVLMHFVLQRVSENAVVDKWFTVSDMADYYAQAMGFVVMKWAKNGMKIPPKEVAHIYEIIINNSLEDMIDIFQENSEHRKYISI